jgi:outer membrane protein TolC
LVAALIGVTVQALPGAGSAQTATPATPAPGSAARGSAGPRVVDLPGAWREARRRSPRLPAAAAAIERAEAAAKLARAGWLPSLRGQATYTRIDGERAIGDRVLVPQDASNAALVLNAPLVDAARWKLSGRARDAVGSERLRAAEVERRLALSLGESYLAVLLQRRAVEVAERAVETSRTQLDIARQRRAGGVGTRLEEVRAERELRDNQGRSALARAALTAAQEALGAVAGAGEPLDAGISPTLPAMPRLAQALSELGERPDVAALSRDVQISQRAVDDGWLDYLPTLGLTATPYLQAPSTATQPERGWQAQLALVVPLFDGGFRSAVQRDRRALLAEAQAALAERLLEAGATLRATAGELVHRERALQDTEASAALADESLQLARTAFREGVGTQVDLIEAERSARDAATAVAVATFDRDRTRLVFLLATGRLPFAR